MASPVSSITSASDIQMDYMKLLITQLKNQNPLEPMDNQAMASQLAQFSQLSQLENMNASFSQSLATAEKNYATSLIGKQVTFAVQNSKGDLEQFKGVVKQAFEDPQKGSMLFVETAPGSSYVLELDGVLAVEG